MEANKWSCHFWFTLSYRADEESDMDVHDRGMLYYRLLKQDVNEVCKWWNLLNSVAVYTLFHCVSVL